MSRYSVRVRRAYLSLDDAGQDALLDATAWRWKPVITAMALLESAPSLMPLAALFGYHYLVEPLPHSWMAALAVAALLVARFWPEKWLPDLHPAGIGLMTSIQLSAVEKQLNQGRQAPPATGTKGGH